MRKTTVIAMVVFLALLASAGMAMEPIYLIEPNGTLPNDLADLVAAAGGTLYRVFPEISLASAFSSDPDFAVNLAASNKIRTVEEDIPMQLVPDVPWGIGLAQHPAAQETHAAGLDPTSAFFYDCQWNLHQVDAAGAWAQDQFGSPSVKVAVLDSGIDPDHLDLIGKVDLANSTSFLSFSPCGPADQFTIDDLNWHGTFVAAQIAGNNLGMASVAPLSEIVAIKVDACNNRGFLVDWIAGILYAASLPDVDVINMSLQSRFPKSVAQGSGGFTLAVFNNAVNFAQNQGKLVVSAAGNFGVDLDKDKNFTQIPADAGAGIAVWAGDINGNLASYSNFGRATWVGAGGGDFTPGHDPLPGCFFGGQDGILSACSTKSVVFPICGTANDFYLLGFSGTSFATPVVAGVAALVDGAAGGSLNPGQLKTVLKNTADDIGPNGTDVLFSHGRVNAGRAVE